MPNVGADGCAARGILVADTQGFCTQVNRRWVEITGSGPAQNSGDGWLEFIHPDDREWLRGEWGACIRTHSDACFRVHVKRGDGQVLATTLAVSPLPTEDGAPAGFVIILEEEKQPKNDAESLHARKMECVGRLASGLAHDFANLLTLISGYSEIALSRLGLNDPVRAEVEEISKASRRGSGLTRQLLTFSRRNSVEPQVLNLNKLVADAQTMLRRVIGEHIDLVTHLGADLGSVKADPGQIEQVIVNLAINARDAMPHGGRIAIRTANVEVDGDDDRVKQGLAPGHYVMVRFDDTGYGMSRDTLEHMFEPFFTTKDKGKGTGLGLASVYGAVKQSHGDVWAESEPGKGTRFTILLPRVEAGSQPLTQNSPEPGSGLGIETILVVEDEESVRRLLEHVLSKQGYTVLAASNGPDALALFQQRQPSIDLVLTDMVMPRMSGRELADRLVELKPDLKVIFMSGYSDEVLVGTGALRPGALFLQKPLRPGLLAERVREVLNGQARQVEREGALARAGAAHGEHATSVQSGT